MKGVANFVCGLLIWMYWFHFTALPLFSWPTAGMFAMLIINDITTKRA